MFSQAWTLDDALNFGEGIERPFRCPSHDDTNASASVNVVKGLWVCYACQAAGTVKDRKAPTAAQLAIMLNPEETCRVYPEQWLDLFRDADYWESRFPAWLCWYLHMGSDPFTGDAIFPVRTAEGRLAGIGRRLENPAEDEPRYKYPFRWSASRTLGGYEYANHSDPIGIFVEGYADMASLREIGTDAFAVFGSGVHAPQYELARRLNKKVWLLGFDMDDAGERAVEAAQPVLAAEGRVARIKWPKKDPAECTPKQRKIAVMEALKTVGQSAYGSLTEVDLYWQKIPQLCQHDYASWQKEIA